MLQLPIVLQNELAPCSTLTRVAYMVYTLTIFRESDICTHWHGVLLISM